MNPFPKQRVLPQFPHLHHRWCKEGCHHHLRAGSSMQLFWHHREPTAAPTVGSPPQQLRSASPTTNCSHHGVTLSTASSVHPSAGAAAPAPESGEQ